MSTTGPCSAAATSSAAEVGNRNRSKPRQRANVRYHLLELLDQAPSVIAPAPRGLGARFRIDCEYVNSRTHPPPGTVECVAQPHEALRELRRSIASADSSRMAVARPRSTLGRTPGAQWQRVGLLACRQAAAAAWASATNSDSWCS